MFKLSEAHITTAAKQASDSFVFVTMVKVKSIFIVGFTNTAYSATSVLLLQQSSVSSMWRAVMLFQFVVSEFFRVAFVIFSLLIVKIIQVFKAVSFKSFLSAFFAACLQLVECFAIYVKFFTRLGLFARCTFLNDGGVRTRTRHGSGSFAWQQELETLLFRSQAFSPTFG